MKRMKNRFAARVRNQFHNGTGKRNRMLLRRLRIGGVLCIALSLACLFAPVRADAAGGGGARLTGYAPLYLPQVVNITVQASPASFGTATGGGTGIAPGENVTVQATPNAGYYFIAWLEDGRHVSDSPTFTFRAERDMNLIANFGQREINSGEPSGPNAADSSSDAGNTQNTGNADSSGGANSASSADSAGNANSAGTADSANTADSTNTAGSANSASTAGNAAAGGAGTDASGTAGTPGGASAANTGSSRPANAQAGAVPYVPQNAGDMPTTGVEDLYRIPVVVMLLLFGVIAVLISLPSSKRGKS